MSIKQDRTGTRTAEDLRRRLNVKSIDEATTKVDASVETVNKLNDKVIGLNASVSDTRQSYVSTNNQTFTEEQKSRARSNIGAGNSSFSGSYDDLTNKPTSLYDINKSQFIKLGGIEAGAEANIIESISVNGTTQPISNKNVNLSIPNQTIDTSMSDSSTNPVQNKVIKKYVDDNMGTATTYFASSYAESGVSILRSSLESKNHRVCFNFVGTKSMSANTTTTLFTLPSEIRPMETRDFVVFGQTNNNDGYIGYGYITSDGLLQVRFNVAITSYIRFCAVYDIY